MSDQNGIRELTTLATEMYQFEQFHPRAVKLFRKRKNFIVIAEDEPYFVRAYAVIRIHEKAKGAWTKEDEKIFQEYVDKSAYSKDAINRLTF